jgi:YD repeat-containing protein
LTITLPQGGTVVITTTTWSTYSGGPSGQTETTMVNGRKLETISTSTVGNVTTRTTTQSMYDEKGQHLRDQVVSEDRETWSVDGTVVQTDTTETHYTYDGQGNRVDSSTTEQSSAVGYDPTEPVMDPEDDPALKELQRLNPEPEDDTVTLAPGEFGSQGQPPSTGTVA